MRLFVIIFFAVVVSACSHFGSNQSLIDKHETINASEFSESKTFKEESKAVIDQALIDTSNTSKKAELIELVDTEKSSTLLENKSLSTNEIKSSNSLITQSSDFPFDPIESRLLDPKHTPAGDFSEYGFFTPNNELESLINDELKSLRANKTPPFKDDLINRIRNDFKLDLDLDNKRIQSQLSWYVRNPNYLTRTFNRASRYLYHVVNEVQKRDLPMELALLPFVESAYNPFAYSHGRASGLWQFIPGTGKIYGLHQDWWQDGRRDVLASTDAALNYLTYLHDLFDGDWLHALAAYNSGSGRVRGAIRKNKKKNKPTDFWSLQLPKETRAYVPKLIALSKVVLSPKEYKLKLPVVKDEPYFEKVDIGAQLDLAQAASMADVDISEIYHLNPGFNQWASSPFGPHRLLVPVEKANLFRENLKALPPEQRIKWHRYAVRSGDSLIKIAKRFNTTPMLIKDINRLKSNLIKVKQKLLIPVSSKKSTFYNLSQNNRLNNKQQKIQAKKGSSQISYKVRSGDTIWDLARAHKVGVRELARWNGMAPTDPIRPGQKLTIWSKRLDSMSSKNSSANLFSKREMIQKVGYYVRKGDSLSKIAKKFNVKISDLVKWNKLNRKKYLKPGQKLKILVDITSH